MSWLWMPVALSSALISRSHPSRALRRRAVRPLRSLARRAATTGAPSVDESYGTYEYDGWKCGVRHKEGCAPPVVLLHPIGLGLSSWYWTRVAEKLPNEVYMPDFVGCGESEPWNPKERGLFLPLDYARQVEALWRDRIQQPCVVATQGGLAPVGVLLAARSSDSWDGARAVAALAMVAPPTWRDISEGLDKTEVARNYEQLTSKIGAFFFDLLRSAFFIRFFSDLFLFADKCDEEWVGLCVADDAREGSREPVFAYNAGIVNARPLFDELVTDIQQPVLVIEGQKDKRQKERAGYEEFVADCARHEVPGACNVPGWENPEDVASALAGLVAKARRAGRLEEGGA